MTNPATREPAALLAQNTDPAPRPNPDSNTGRRWIVAVPNLLALILAIALCAGITLNWDRWIGSHEQQHTNDATLQLDLVPLSALVAAPVLRVAVEDYQKVERGDLLIKLDPLVFAAQLAQAEANVAGVQRSIDLIRSQQDLQQANIAAALANLAGVQATRHRDDLEEKRQRKLLQSGVAGTEQLVERAYAALTLTTAQVMQASATLEGTRRQLAVLRHQQAQQEANLQAVEAARDLARINLGYTRITAPISGMVSRRSVYPGQCVGVGAQVITVATLPQVYVIANFREVQFTRLREGQLAVVTVDSFPGVSLHGRVTAWSPGTGSVFALLPPDNATGNFTKVVQRIPVKIVLDADGGLEDKLRAGMSVDVTIDTGAAP